MRKDRAISLSYIQIFGVLSFASGLFGLRGSNFSVQCALCAGMPLIRWIIVSLLFMALLTRGLRE